VGVAVLIGTGKGGRRLVGFEVNGFAHGTCWVLGV